MKPRQLKSGAWNCRLMIEGQSYSFTHADKKTVIRMAAEFADEYRKTDADIIEHLNMCENVQGYLKNLIRKDMGA